MVSYRVENIHKIQTRKSYKFSDFKLGFDTTCLYLTGMDQDYFNINFMKPIRNEEHLRGGIDRCNIDEDEDAMLVILFNSRNGVL